MSLEKYIYAAKIIDVYDGDTVTAEVELGFHVRQTMKLRLARINAPELREPEKLQGLASRDWLRDKILNKDVTIKTYKDKQEKYGRYLADIYVVEDMTEESVEFNFVTVCINDAMVENGLAEYKDY